MINQFNQFNHWYDNIKEPKRFLLMLAMALPLIFLASSFFPPEIRMFGLTGMLSLIGIRLWSKLGL